MTSANHRKHYLAIIKQAEAFLEVVTEKRIFDPQSPFPAEIKTQAHAALKTALSMLSYDELPPQYQRKRFAFRYDKEHEGKFQLPPQGFFPHPPAVLREFEVNGHLSAETYFKLRPQARLLYPPLPAKPEVHDFLYASDEDVAYAVAQGWIKDIAEGREMIAKAWGASPRA